MRVEMTWTVSAEHVGDQPCAICGRRFWLGPATAYAVSDRGVLVGEVCPACLEGGPGHMAGELERRVEWSRLQAEEDEAFASEPFEDCPTLDEFLALEAVLCSPLYATVAEAEAELAFAETEPGCARSLAGRKESLMERQGYVGGVSEEQRSAQEQRFEELGLEEFFWSFVRLQGRVDDLEEQLRALRGEAR